MSLERPTPESFVVVDLDGADRADGVARWARKILVDGARWLARSRTYGWATIGRPISGASVGISAAPEDRDAAVASFDQAPPGSVGLGLDAGKGLAWSDLPTRTADDWRNPLLATDPDAVRLRLVTVGVTTAASAHLGGLDGRTVAFEGPEPVVRALGEAFTALGATLADQDDHTIAGAAAASADVLVCGSAVGVLDHETAAALAPGLVVPWGTMPVTTRALAVARRRQVEVLPDFLTTAGPLVAAVSDGADEDAVAASVAELVTSVVEEVRDHDEGPLIGACLRAEAYLATWRDELPFGRPIA